MCQLRASVPALFTGLKREHAAKNRDLSVVPSPPKAEATGSNPVGCATNAVTGSASIFGKAFAGRFPKATLSIVGPRSGRPDRRRAEHNRPTVDPHGAHEAGRLAPFSQRSSRPAEASRSVAKFRGRPCQRFLNFGQGRSGEDIRLEATNRSRRDSEEAPASTHGDSTCPRAVHDWNKPASVARIVPARAVLQTSEGLRTMRLWQSSDASEADRPDVDATTGLFKVSCVSADFLSTTPKGD